MEYSDAYNYYLLGNFQMALKTLQKIKLPESSLKLKTDILTYRIYIAQKKFGIVLDEVKEDCDSPELKLARLLALYFARPDQRSSILPQLDSLAHSSSMADDDSKLILLATIYLNAGLTESALRVLHEGSDIYCNALTVQCLIAMHRYDLAGKAVLRMQAADEDALPCQLSIALFNLFKGGDQLQEAMNTYEELKERYGSTPVILNGQASASIGMGRWGDAESFLQESLDLDSNNPDTLVNLIMVSEHLGKPTEVINRLMSQLRDADKNHPFIRDYFSKEEEFGECAKHYAPTVMG